MALVRQTIQEHGVESLAGGQMCRVAQWYAEQSNDLRDASERCGGSTPTTRAALSGRDSIVATLRDEDCTQHADAAWLERYATEGGWAYEAGSTSPDLFSTAIAATVRNADSAARRAALAPFRSGGLWTMSAVGSGDRPQADTLTLVSAIQLAGGTCTALTDLTQL